MWVSVGCGGRVVRLLVVVRGRRGRQVIWGGIRDGRVGRRAGHGGGRPIHAGAEVEDGAAREQCRGAGVERQDKYSLDSGEEQRR